MLMVSISSCKTLNQSLPDSFCSQYQEVIQKIGDGTIIASEDVKKRLAANEVNYKCQCKGVKANYCKLGSQ